METIPCRGCRTELDASATMCPICLRPRGKLEITRDFAALREDQKQRRRRPFVILGRLLLAAAAGGLAYLWRDPLAAAASSAHARAAQAWDAAMDPKVLETIGRAEPDAASPAPPTAPPKSAPTPAPSGPNAPVPPAAAASAAPAPPPAHANPARVEDLPIPALDSSTQWAFYGRAYDLITLRPVADVQLNFQAAGGNGGGASAQTDEHGRFCVVLARLGEGSYEIHGSRQDYAPFVFYESDIPYGKLSLAERRELALNAQDGDIPRPSLTDVAGEASRRRDVFVAPLR